MFQTVASRVPCDTQTVTNGNDHVKIIDRLRTPLLICLQKMQTIRLIHLPLLKSVANMSADDGTVPLEKFYHLFLRQPYRIIRKLYFQPHRIIWLIDDYLILPRHKLVCHFIFLLVRQRISIPGMGRIPANSSGFLLTIGGINV